MELEAFKDRVLPLREKLQHIAGKLTEEKADAEDIVQETFLKLWYLREKLDEYQSVEALAVTMTKNAALDQLRKKRPSGIEPEMVSLEAQSVNPEEKLMQTDAVACIRKLIAQLPELQQLTIRMKDVEGYEIHEIAEITGCQPETVRVNLSRARKKIREQYLQLNREPV